MLFWCLRFEVINVTFKVDNMFDFVSTKENVERWNISQKRASVLCGENRNNCEIMVANNHNSVLKPFVKWAGGKGQIVRELEKMLPINGEKDLTKYCEPMVGGGALFFNILSKYDFEEMYIGDINAELINAYQVIKRNIDSLIEKLQEMQTFFWRIDKNGRKLYYYSVRENFNTTSLCETTAIDKAADFIFLNRTCFNGLYRVNKHGQFNVPMGEYKKPKICDFENLRNVHKALQNATIVCGDYSLSKKFIDKNTFVYFDPPYRPLSKTSSFISYTSDIFDDDAQRRLAKFVDEINKIGAKFVLSNSDPKNVNFDDTFFDELYKEYEIKRISASRMINSKAANRGKINELLICN